MAIKKHIKFSQVRHRNSTKSWHKKLENVPAFLIGNGPSLNDVDVSLLYPYFTIGINRAFLKIDPTILMWQDLELWYNHRKQMLQTSSIKICRNVSDPQNRFFHFKLHGGSYKIPKQPNALFGMGSTGPLAAQLAYTLGCSPLVLLGYDCMPRGEDTDFYGKNRHHKSHTMRNCNKGLVWLRDELSEHVKIINCGDNDVFQERRDLEDVMSELGPEHKKSRSHWVSKLV